MTNESKFDNYCDKLEMMIQMKIYEEGGYSNLYSSKNKYLVWQDWIQELINNEDNSISDIFFDYHISSSEGNIIFNDLALCVKK